jgi:shikimate kinase
MRHLFLIGFRGSGKSTIARMLGDALQRPVVDTDLLIEQRAKQSIREIFEVHGEVAFREMESAVLTEVADNRAATIVSTGGGAVLRLENRQRMRDSGRCIWLQASAEELFRRISNDHNSSDRRPNLSASGGFEEVADLLAKRNPLYQELSEKLVATDGRQPDEVVAEILDWVKSSAL